MDLVVICSKSNDLLEDQMSCLKRRSYERQMYNLRNKVLM